MKLLVVDSDRDLVEMITVWLKTLGHEVHRGYTEASKDPMGGAAT